MTEQPPNDVVDGYLWWGESVAASAPTNLGKAEQPGEREGSACGSEPHEWDTRQDDDQAKARSGTVCCSWHGQQEGRGAGVRAMQDEPSPGTHGDSGALSKERFTRQEQTILRLLAEGRRNKEIARELVLSVRTVEWHVRNLHRKASIKSRRELAAFAVRLGCGSAETKTP